MSRIITSVSGSVFHLSGNDIDTDRILPARFLKGVTFEGLGDHVFEDERKQVGLSHPFTMYKNKDYSILIVDENFGSGSSREHVVPSLMQWGIKGIIGLSFSEIFRGNAAGNGLVCVSVDKETHSSLVKNINYNLTSIVIDVQNLVISYEDTERTYSCSMSHSIQGNFISGTWNHITTCSQVDSLVHKKAASLPYFKM